MSNANTNFFRLNNNGNKIVRGIPKDVKSEFVTLISAHPLKNGMVT
jgi:hypothetical protein